MLTPDEQLESRCMPTDYEEAVMYLEEKHGITFQEAEEMYSDMMADFAENAMDRERGN